MYRKIIATEEKTDSKSLKSDENASKKIIFKYHYNTIQLYNLNNSKFTEKKIIAVYRVLFSHWPKSKFE